MGTLTVPEISDEVEKLRYGENPHQEAEYRGNLDPIFKKVQGEKELSYNNLLDVDSAIKLAEDFWDGSPMVGIFKHLNPCCLAVRETLKEAWVDALEADPTSAFGGVLVFNKPIDDELGDKILKTLGFFEVIIAPSYSDGFLKKLQKGTRKNVRVLELQDGFQAHLLKEEMRTVLNGVLLQERDTAVETEEDFNVITKREPGDREKEDLLFAAKAVKYLKSNAIVIVHNGRIIGEGMGQPNRVDALRQAIQKAKDNGLGYLLEGSVIASEALFPFKDSVVEAREAGIMAVIQPGGSIRDQESIDACDQRGMAMVFSGRRHFRH